MAAEEGVAAETEESIHPELKKVAFEMYVANLDYEEHKGNMELAPEFWKKFEEAREDYRAAKRELEKKLGHPL